MKSLLRFRTAFLFAALLGTGLALGVEQPSEDKFRQLEELLPTPNAYRTASGAPGHAYWQQRVDYQIAVAIDDEKQHLTGSETITYHNQSPDTLDYLWVQLDPNLFSPESHGAKISTAPTLTDTPRYRTIKSRLARAAFDGSVEIARVANSANEALSHTIVDTMMRIELEQPLQGGASFAFDIDWNYAINNHKTLGGRTGYEFFEDDENYLYEIAQWFPRMAAYTDADGWQNKPFLGRGEFTLEFGNYEVAITVPADHIVASTGVLQNSKEVLTADQRSRLNQAKGVKRPVFIVTPEEAKANESSRSTETKTWVYHAENVRDFAFASSRKFIWDAVESIIEGNSIMAMSYYPNEGEPLWSLYSTQAIVHTLEVYSKFTFPYPYPVAISVNGPVGGMEYPMICFNGPRPEDDGTYDADTKYALIGVIIHEVGHNWFPMIVNSDERQWTWMDEGLNSFVQYLAEQEWEEDYPSWAGEPKDITRYMSSERQRPIMTNSESILQFGPNGYFKPATALNVLRESILGRENFDYAFKRYAQRWQFRRPGPWDFFRTMEDASAVDLDWFWRGWFYGTEHTDISIDRLKLYNLDTRDPKIEKPLAKVERDAEPKTIAQQRNKPLPKRVEAFPELIDFYNTYDELDVLDADLKAYEDLVEGLEEDDRELLKSKLNFYVVDLTNHGGLVMPVILELHCEDGTTIEKRIPAEIWRQNSKNVSKLIITDRRIEKIVLDPHLETADTNRVDNYFPRRIEEQRIQLKGSSDDSNPMRDAIEAVEKAAEDAADEAKAAAADSEE
ncbi:MAG: hypothetical protein ACI8TQ_000969 [Planctomycetota bacterium]|jgi:hypothetical protein